MFCKLVLFRPEVENASRSSKCDYLRILRIPVPDNHARVSRVSAMSFENIRVRLFDFYHAVAYHCPIPIITSIALRSAARLVLSAKRSLRARTALTRLLNSVGVVLDLAEQCTESVNDPTCPHRVITRSLANSFLDACRISEELMRFIGA